MQGTRWPLSSRWHTSGRGHSTRTDIITFSDIQGESSCWGFVRTACWSPAFGSRVCPKPEVQFSVGSRKSRSCFNTIYFHVASIINGLHRWFISHVIQVARIGSHENVLAQTRQRVQNRYPSVQFLLVLPEFYFPFFLFSKNMKNCFANKNMTIM
jgi:hypothetical protein